MGQWQNDAALITGILLIYAEFIFASAWWFFDSTCKSNLAIETDEI